MRGGVLCRCESGDGLEGAMKMVGTHAGVGRHRLERYTRVSALDEAAHACNSRRIVPRRSRRLVRLAPFARTKAGQFSISTGGVKLDVLRPCPTSRTRGPAVHSCRSDGVVKGTVRRPIATDDGRPAWVILRRLRKLDRCPLTHVEFLLNHPALHGSTVGLRRISRTPILAIEFERQLPWPAVSTLFRHVMLGKSKAFPQ